LATCREGNQNWTSLKIGSIALSRGKQKFTLHFKNGGANIGYIKFSQKNNSNFLFLKENAIALKRIHGFKL
jgi:hypothetical protein